MAAYLANVGVNAGHSARSPLFEDGTFALLPIPERHAGGVTAPCISTPTSIHHYPRMATTAAAPAGLSAFAERGQAT